MGQSMVSSLMKSKKIKIGVIGGSGFTKLLDKVQEIKAETPYGSPSGKIALGRVGRRKVAFLPRHNPTHDLPPHRIPYRANVWALKSLGVERIITCTAVGSLQKNIHPGDFVILDQFIDRTRNRQDTFYEGPITTHVSAAYPYCPDLRKVAVRTGKHLGIKIHPRGTVVVIGGPRFSTIAESTWFTKMGWSVVNMTQYPEVFLARELEICYCALALVTDYDVGIVALKNVKPVGIDQILKVMTQNNERAQELILSMIEKMPAERNCDCRKALDGARID